MARTLIVLMDDPGNAELRGLATLVSGDAVSLLVLNRDLADLHFSEDRSTWAGIPIRELGSLRYLQQAVPVARDKYKEFVARWPQRFRHQGKDFKELFVHEGKLSLWWLTELCLKNNEDRPAFGYLVKLEALRLALVESPCDRVLLLVGNPDLADVLAQACRASGYEARVFSSGRFHNPDSLPRLALRRLKHFLLDLIATALAKTVHLAKGRRRLPPTGAIAFHTWYPLEWAQYHGQFLDRYYVDVPQALEEHRGGRTIYLAAIQPKRLRAITKVGRQFFPEQDDLGGRRVVFVERFISLFRLCALYADVRDCWRYLRLERQPAFRDSFRYDDGVNIFPIARHELRLSFVTGFPPLLAQAHRVRKFVREARPRALVTFLELYHYGRALTYGVRSAGVGTKIVGYQHSRITRNQLFYNYAPGEIIARPESPDDMVANMPIPDLFLLHGRHAHRLLSAAGYPEDRMCLTGSPRFDDLAQLRKQDERDRLAARSRFSVPAGQRLVAVATPFWAAETRRLVDLAFDATADRPEIWLLFKPHPNYADIDGIVCDSADRVEKKQFGLTGENLQVLAAAADAMLTVNSTSGAEALVANCPVINVRLTEIDVSPFVEVTDVVPEAYDSDQVRDVLDRILGQPVDAKGVEEVIEGVFYKLDGKAKERTANAILAVALGGDAGPAEAVAVGVARS